MDSILFQLGPFTVYAFGASIAVGTLIAIWLADREAKRVRMDADQISTLSIILLVAGILGARIFFVMLYDPAYYFQHPLDIFRIYEGGLSIHGGILGSILAGLWYTRRTALSFWVVSVWTSTGVWLSEELDITGDLFRLKFVLVSCFGLKV